MSQFSQDTEKMLDTLRKVAAKTLERKRRLGQYAVIWQDGKPVKVGEDAPNRSVVLPSDLREHPRQME